jgi:hypothetical protein
MQEGPPIIDLAGHQRLRSLEWELALSPVGIALTLMGIVALLLAAAGAVFVIGSLFGFIALAEEEGVPIGGGLVLAGGLLLGAYFGLGRAYMYRRVARLPCPYCGGALSCYVADMEEAERGRWGEKGIYLDGHRYCAPLGDGDKRPWVRAMKEVWACVGSRAYIDFDEPHELTCSEEELARLRQHSCWREAR